jgi:mannose-binding lectin 2
MVNNGSLKYDHDRDGTHTEVAGCESKFRGVDHPTYLMIKYEGDTLTVSTDIEGKSEWHECFSVKGVQLPTGYYIGVSAATGELSDNHDVISIKTFELDAPVGEVWVDRSQIIPSALTSAPHRDHVDDPAPRSSGLKIFFIVIFSVLGIVGVIVGGIYYYQQKETRKNRFY